MNRTDIPWATHSWNPTSGCNGPNGKPCSYCYARKMSARFGRSFAPTVHPERLDAPMSHRKPARVFVDSNGDLFDPVIPDEFIDDVFAVMAWCQQHTFQVLTKQARRMCSWAESVPERRPLPGRGVCTGGSPFCMGTYCETHDGEVGWCGSPWPLPNIHLGITAEDQDRLDERAPQLMETPAVVRFLSIEPLLGPVDLSTYLKHWEVYDPALGSISWVIIGELSGKAPSEQVKCWARDIIDQCRAAGVRVFVKNRLYETFPIQEYPEVKL